MTQDQAQLGLMAGSDWIPVEASTAPLLVETQLLLLLHIEVGKATLEFAFVYITPIAYFYLLNFK